MTDVRIDMNVDPPSNARYGTASIESVKIREALTQILKSEKGTGWARIALGEGPMDANMRKKRDTYRNYVLTWRRTNNIDKKFPNLETRTASQSEVRDGVLTSWLYFGIAEKEDL